MDRVRGRWLFVLLLALAMHFLSGLRNYIASATGMRTICFGAIGGLTLLLAYLATVRIPVPSALFASLDVRLRGLIENLRTYRKGLMIATLVGMLVVATAGIALRVDEIGSVPIDPQRADMLPLVSGACGVLAEGGNPYTRVFEMPWELPLTLWPGMWGPYLLPYTLGIDLRWLHVAVVLLIAGIFASFMLEGIGKGKGPARVTPIVAGAGIVLLLLSPQLIHYTSTIQTPPLWLWIALLCAAIIRGRSLLAALWLGLAMASRQTLVVVAPILTIYWLRKFDSPAKAFGRLAIAAMVFILVSGPFLLSSPREFLFDPIDHYSRLGERDFLLRGANGSCAGAVGLTYAIRKTGPGWVLGVASVLAAVAPSALAWFRMKCRTDALLHMGLACTLVVLVAPIPWTYEYIPGFLIFLFAAVSAASAEGDRRAVKGEFRK